MLTEVFRHSHWLKFKCAFENHRTVGNRALADKACYHTVLSSCSGQRLSLSSLSSRDLWNKLSFLSLEAGSSMGPFILFQQKGKDILVDTLRVLGLKRAFINEQEKACDYMCSQPQTIEMHLG